MNLGESLAEAGHNILGLIQDGLLDVPTLYLSRSILQTRGTYYRLLGRVTTHAEWEPWILYMLDAVAATSQWTTHKIKAVKAGTVTKIVVQNGSPVEYGELLMIVE